MEKNNSNRHPLSRFNFLLMGGCGLLILLGFLLMLGKSTGADAFEADIFSTRRIVVGPLIAFIGYVAMGVAIMWKKR